MQIGIRPADLQADRALLVDLQRRNLGVLEGEQRFDWLYLRNPHGKAMAWIALDEETKCTIGTAAAFPKRMYLGGSLQLGYVLGDFCIEPNFRSLAAALQLQGVCLEGLDSAGSTIAYDFPSDRMMSIYKRMNIPTAGRYVRWAKPLRADRQVMKFIKREQLSKWLAVPVNQLMEWTDIKSDAGTKWKIASHEEDCGEEFTRLAACVASLYGTCVARSADYLNWRYRKHPSTRYEILTAHRGEDLHGFLVFACEEEDARIVDLFGVSDATMWKSLLAELFRRLRYRRIITISFPSLETNPWVESLRKFGFSQREYTPIVICASKKLSDGCSSATSPLFLVDGDRES
jgi:hypothetical protein